MAETLPAPAIISLTLQYLFQQAGCMPISLSLFQFRGDGMNYKNLRKNDEAVSLSVGFMLMFSITVIVFTALIISFYALSGNIEKTAMRESFKIVGEGLAIKITTVDMLISLSNSYGGSVNSVEYEFSMPESIASKSYTINITNSTYQIILESDNGARIVAPFNISANFNARKIYSGGMNYKAKFDNINNIISIEEY